jgi:hypothetical protein
MEYHKACDAAQNDIDFAEWFEARQEGKIRSK